MGAKNPLTREEWLILCEQMKDVDLTNLGREGRALIAQVVNVVPDDEPFGQSLFDALTYVAGCSPAFEGGLARKKDGRVQIYLRQRSMNESAYPGEWHLPGTFFRKGEQPIAVARRLCKSEFEGVVVKSILHLEDFFVDEARGNIESKLYAIEVEGDPTGKSGKWFDLEDVPSPLVDHHAEKLIPRLLKYMGEVR